MQNGIIARVLFVIISISFKSVFGQNSDTLIRSLHHKALEARSDTARLSAITNLFWEYSLSQPKKADSLVEVEMKLAKKIRSDYWISMAWNDKAILALRKSDFKAAISALNQSLAIREKLGRPDLLASTYSKLGNAYAQLNQTEKALSFLFKSLSFYEKLDKKGEAGIVLSAIGAAFVNLKDPTKAIGYLDRAANLFKEVGDDYSYHTALANMGNAFSELKKPKEAIPLLLKCEKSFEKFGDSNGLSNVLGSLGMCYRQLGDHKSGLIYYHKAFQLSKSLGDSVGQAVFGHNIGNAMLDLGKFDSARIYFNEAEQICRKLKLVEQHKMVKFSQIKLLFKEKAPTKSKLLEDFKALSDSLEKQQNLAFAQEMDVKYGTELREAKIRNLSTENRLRQLEIKEKEASLRNARWLIFLAVGLAISLLVVGFVTQSRQKIRNQLVLSQALAEEQRRGLLAVIEAQEAERSHIAAELHDSIGQQLGALKFRIENLPEASDLLSNSISELRQISHRMMPLTLTRFGLEKAVKELLEEVLKPAGLSYEFDSWNLPDQIPETLKLAIYRSLQEIVNNVLKHADASHFSLQIYVNKDWLIVRSEDNGKGLSSDAEPSGMGMLNLKTRVSSQNGELVLENGPENGLITVMRFPFASET